MAKKDHEISWISAKDAADLAGYSPRHIANLIQSGKLSATRGDKGEYKINKAEFFRVFPDAFTKDQRKKSQEIDDAVVRNVLETEIRHLRDMVYEKDRQIDYLKEQTLTCNTEKKMILDTLASNTRLLEDKSQSKKKRFLGIF